MTRPPPTTTLFPYTTLFRSVDEVRGDAGDAVATLGGGRDLPERDREHLFQGRDGARLGRAGDVVDLLLGLRSEEHTSELQSLAYLVCRLLLEKKKNMTRYTL